MDKNKFHLNVEITSNQTESDFNLYSVLKMCYFYPVLYYE